jgi:transcription elongation factor Elf1
MVHAQWYSTTFSCIAGIHEQRVSGTVDRTRWTNSIACSFPDLKPFDVYLCGHLKSTVCATDVCDIQDLHQRVEN